MSKARKTLGTTPTTMTRRIHKSILLVYSLWANNLLELDTWIKLFTSIYKTFIYYICFKVTKSLLYEWTDDHISHVMHKYGMLNFHICINIMSNI